MATNPDRPRGFTPVNRDGGEYNGTVRVFTVDSSNTTDIGVGDPVVLQADGNVHRAGATGDILGSVEGVKVDLDVAETEHPGFAPAGKEVEVFVKVANPEDVFLIQEDSDTTNLSKAAVGSTVDLTTGAVNTKTGRSTFELDSSATSSGTLGPVILYGLVEQPDNSTGTNAEWLVQINRPQFKGSPLSGGI